MIKETYSVQAHGALPIIDHQQWMHLIVVTKCGELLTQMAIIDSNYAQLLFLTTLADPKEFTAFKAPWNSS